MPHAPQFTGRELDPETGLYYYRSRYYAPQTGRFTTADPIGLFGGPNLYSYVNNNPVNWIDPWGLLGKKTGDPILDDPVVKENIQMAWKESYLPNGDTREEGGWIIAIEGGGYAVRRAYPSSSYEINLGEPPAGAVASFHTHPDSDDIPPGWKDVLLTNGYRVPDYVISKELIYEIPFPNEVVDKTDPRYYPIARTDDYFGAGDEGTDAPEPATMVLAGLGIATLTFYGRKRKRKE